MISITKTVYIWRKCNNCSAEKVIFIFPFIVKSKIIELFQWESLLVERNNKPPIRVIRKVTHDWTIQKILEVLVEQLHEFSIHNFTPCFQMQCSQVQSLSDQVPNMDQNRDHFL